MRSAHLAARHVWKMADKVRKLKDAAARHMAKGRTEKALDAYLQVVRLEPHDLPSRQKCGDLHRKLGETEKAIAAYQAVAGAYAADGLLLKAIALSKVILQIDPEHKETQKTLADLYSRKRGDVGQAAMPASMSAAIGAAGSKTAATIRGRPSSQIGLAQTRAEAEANAVRPTADLDGAAAEAAAALEQEVEAEASPEGWAVAGEGGVQTEAPPESPVLEPPSEAAIEVRAAAVEEIEIIDEIEIEPDLDEDEEEVLFDIEFFDEPAEAAQPHTVDLDTLPPIPLFSDLPKRAFIQLLEQIELHHFEDGAMVLTEGDVGDSFFVVASGQVRVVKSHGKNQLDLARLGEGSFFGEMALLGDGERKASVISEGDSEVLEISQTMLNDLTNEYSSVKQVMSRFYKHRLISNLMKTSPIFNQLDADSRKELVEKFKSRELQRGAKILEEGQMSDALYVVLNGRCEVSRKVGGKRRVLSELREGDVFGEMSLLSREPAQATVRTTRKSMVLRLPAKTFTEVIMWHPQILELVSTLSDTRNRSNTEDEEPPVFDHDEVRV